MLLKKGLEAPKSIRQKDTIRTIEALGGVFVRQTKHKRYKIIDKYGKPYLVDIPQNDDIDGPLLSSIIKQTGVGKKRFWEAYFSKK